MPRPSQCCACGSFWACLFPGTPRCAERIETERFAEARREQAREKSRMTMSRKEKTILSSLAAGAALLAMWIADPPEAGATPNPDDVTLFCQRIDLDPSPQSFLLEVRRMREDGLSKEQAVEVIDQAIGAECPRHLPDLKAAIDFFEGRQPAEKTTPAPAPTRPPLSRAI